MPLKAFVELELAYSSGKHEDCATWDVKVDLSIVKNAEFKAVTPQLEISGVEFSLKDRLGWRVEQWPTHVVA